MRTAVTVGVSADCISRLNLLKKKMDITKMELDKIEQGLAKFEEMEKERGVSYKEDPRRVALLRTRIQNTATLAGDEGECNGLCDKRCIPWGIHSDQGSGFKCEEQCKMRGVLSSERKDLYENS